MQCDLARKERLGEVEGNAHQQQEEDGLCPLGRDCRGAGREQEGWHLGDQDQWTLPKVSGSQIFRKSKGEYDDQRRFDEDKT